MKRYHLEVIRKSDTSKTWVASSNNLAELQNLRFRVIVQSAAIVDFDTTPPTVVAVGRLWQVKSAEKHGDIICTLEWENGRPVVIPNNRNWIYIEDNNEQ